MSTGKEIAARVAAECGGVKPWTKRIRPGYSGVSYVAMEAMQAEIEVLLENARLRDALADIAYGLEGSRIWGGMEWSYAPLHPFKYLPLRDKARAALGEKS